jgi:DNA polymerase-4
MRVACAYIPHFYLQVEHHKDPNIGEKPVVIVGMPEERGIVLDCSKELLQRGVKPSMPLKDVYSLCFDAVPIVVRRTEYTILWEDILSSVAGITLRIESKEPGTFYLDVTRLPGTYKSEQKLARALVSLIAEKYCLRTKVAVGNSRFLTLEAALSGPQDVLVVSSGKEKKFLSNLSIDHLPVGCAVQQKLHLLGLHSIGQVGTFTLSALTSQFGAPGKVLWEISNGIEEQDRIHPAFTITNIDQEMVCDTPVFSRDQVKSALLVLLDRLCVELEDLKKACRAITLVCDLENRTFLEQQFVFHAATASKDDMLRRIMAGLEHVELKSPIRIMSVRASSLEAYAGKQEGLFRTRSPLSEEIKNISGFLKTKYEQDRLFAQ